MSSFWIFLILSFACCSALVTLPEDLQWNYPYRKLYSRYLTENTPTGDYYNSKDGTYRFSYDTGFGDQQSFRYETRDRFGTVIGFFGLVDTSGVLSITEYVSDRFGFRAKTTLRYLVFS